MTSSSLSGPILSIGIVSFILVTIFFGFMTFLVYQVQSTTQGVFEGLEDKLYETRMIYSPSCFAYLNEESGRTYSGIIDINKVNDDTVRRCLPLTKQSERGIRIEIVYLENGVNNAISAVTPNFDKVSQQKLVVNNYPVIVKDKGPGEIIFTHRIV